MNFEELTGKVILPSDPDYNILRHDYNLDINKFPLALVYCYDSKDVSNAIKWCIKNNVGLRVRSGGHNYEGYSIGNDILVIDTTYMNEISIDTQNDLVKIQAGARLGAIYSKLAEQGYAFVGGTCPTVGISGLVLGGGIGLSTRHFGLVTDNLIEAEMINYKGQQLNANKDENLNLYWALRGAGGGNFGVVTSYTFKIYKVDKITLIELRWDASSKERFFSLWQQWLKHVDSRISCFAGVYKEMMYLNGFFYGEKLEAIKILNEFLLLPGLMETSTIEYVPYITAVKAIGSQYGPPDSFKSTGRFVFKDLSKIQIKNLVEFINMSPGENNCSIRLYTLGGVVSKKANYQTAFYYRRAKYIIGISAEWGEDEANNERDYKNWVSEVFDYIHPITNGSYVNFPYAELNDYGHAYYGKNYPRLKRIKKMYDPHNVFKFPQSIELMKNNQS